MPDSEITNPEYFPNTQKLRYLIPKELIGYNTITDYLPISIGLYKNYLPGDYFKNVFRDSKYLTMINKVKSLAYQLYEEKIFELKTLVDLITNRYKEQVKETNILEDNSFFEEEKLSILDNLKLIDNNIADETTNDRYIIKYLVTHPHPKMAKKNYLIHYIDEDIKTILAKLYELSLYSDNIDDDELNSFKRFCENIIIHMRANLSVNYPKSIVNYSCFMYSIKGYPCCTPSKRIYSINNNTEDENKFNSIILYMKNSDALISYLYDIRFKDNAESFIQEEWILRLAYCLCIALLSYRSEYIEYQYITQNTFGTRL